ncbi:MAG: PEP-CTERM sorting domain-containing protein [Bryobacteraceae bacterium]
MKNKISFAAVAVVLTGLAIAPQPCSATAITFDLKNVKWDFGTTTESFDVQMLGARGNLTFALTPVASAYPIAVSTAYTAIEKTLVINVPDQPTRQILSIQADLHFNGGLLDVTVNTIEVRSFSSDLSATPGLQGIQTFFVGADPRSDSMKLAQWSRYQNLTQTVSSYHFNFTDDNKLFSPLTVIPAGFLVPVDTSQSSGGGGGGLNFDVSADAPEPGSIGLALSGLGALLFYRRKRT